MKKLSAVAAGFLLVYSACSTPPENSGDVYDLRTRAEAQLDLGNKQANQGSLTAALPLLDEAMRLAVACDDPGLRIRARLSRSNVLFSLGLGEEAAAGWNEALREAERAGNAELAAVCRVHSGWGTLMAGGGQPAAQTVRDEAARELNLIKSDQLYAAFAWKVIGLAEKELGRYGEAEASVQRSLSIHEKGRRFELAAYDWFMIASFRSLAGNYAGARQALESAMAFDRRVENSWGLACDWRALGDVLKKAGDFEASGAAYRRAADIFRALGNEETAIDALSRIENR